MTSKGSQPVLIEPEPENFERVKLEVVQFGANSIRMQLMLKICPPKGPLVGFGDMIVM